MSFWTAAVIIVLIWGVVTMYSHRRDRDLGIARDEDGKPVFPPPADGFSQREIEELRERIRVLERIATDSNTLDANETKRIAAEIEALRDRKVD
ncbi:hypothetical protein [Qipengyuania sp.]|uniref:hypothetical protein n=1 Tax=Qipengyuania sp. TaxID=2004515 RepID=UPI003734C78E